MSYSHKCKHCKENVEFVSGWGQWRHTDFMMNHTHNADTVEDGVLLLLETEEIPTIVNFNIKHTDYLYEL